MTTRKKPLTDFMRIVLTTIITTPIMISVPLVFVLVVSPAWVRFLSLQNNGVQTQAEIIQVQQSSVTYGQTVISVNYRFSVQGQSNIIYNGQSAIGSEVPTIGSTIVITYLRDDPTISQIGDKLTLWPLLAETLSISIIAIIGFILTTLLSVQIAARIERA